MEFESIVRHDVPPERGGKSKKIIMELLSDLARLSDGSALRISLSELPDSKENCRAAIIRACHQQQIPVATSSDDEYLYVWRIHSEGSKRPE